MPFRGITVDETRREFVQLARQEDVNRRELCRRFGISPTTGYQWLARFAVGGMDAVVCRSRRPHRSPGRTEADMEEQILILRDAHPTWGARKLRAVLQARALPAPATSTITTILHRHQRIDPQHPRTTSWQRYEHDQPNALWQMDFMGHRPLGTGRVHPLTVIDDHSRFGLVLTACAHEREDLVRQHLTSCFERYGLPWAILADNGPPWGSSFPRAITRMDVWLMRLGIRVIHGRPLHPQTQGKIERWHRTIAADVFALRRFTDAAAIQQAFDTFRQTYNHDRPHDAIHLQPPIPRYQVSPRCLPSVLPAPTYDEGDAMRKVRSKGEVHFAGRRHFVGGGLVGEWVGIRPTTTDGLYQVRFCHREIGSIDLRTNL